MNERKFKQNHSSDLFTFTRVISKRKQARKTVGITINPKILEEARNRNLNISRICEQALGSILDYLPQENRTVSSKSLNPCSLQRENGRAGRSAWYDRHVGIVEVPGSNPGPSTRTLLESRLIEKLPELRASSYRWLIFWK
jgi:Post-segregation antitoxin CcdA